MSLTNDLVFECLVALDCFTITLALVFFTIEIFNRLVVQQTVCMDATRNLGAWFRLCFREEGMCGQTVSRSFIARRNQIRQRVRRMLAATNEA